MKEFKDKQGRTWAVEVTAAAVSRVRDLAHVDLLDVGNQKLLERLTTDPMTLVDVLCAICRPQLQKLGISDEAFGEAFAGDVIDEATDVFIEEWIAFFPKAPRGPLREALHLTRDAMNRQSVSAVARLTSPQAKAAIEQMLVDADERMDKVLAKLSGGFGDSPESSASTLESTRSVSSA